MSLQYSQNDLKSKDIDSRHDCKPLPPEEIFFPGITLFSSPPRGWGRSRGVVGSTIRRTKDGLTVG